MARRAVSPPDFVRTVALAGPQGVGKTRLAEHLLHLTGVVRAPAGPSERPLLDADPEAPLRGGSAVPAWAWLPWREGVVHLTDTPGGADVRYPAEVARWGADLEVVVLDGSRPVDAASVAWFEAAERRRSPRVLVWTHTDRGVDVVSRTRELSASSRATLVPVSLVVGDAVVDLLRPPEPVDVALPWVCAARERALEAIAEADDEALEAYLEHLDLPDDLARVALARAVRRCAVVPVFAVSGLDGRGVRALLDALVDLGPGPDGLPDGEPVVEVVGTWLDDDHSLVTMFRVREGTLTPNAHLTTAEGTRVRVHKLHRVRGPRRALAEAAGPGEVVASWEPLGLVPGETLGAEGRAPPTARPPLAWRRLIAPTPKAAAFEAALRVLLALDPSLRASFVAPGVIDVAGSSAGQIDTLAGRLRRRFGLDVSVQPQPVADIERPVAWSGPAEGRALGRSGAEPVSTFVLEVGPSADEAPWWLEGEVDEEDLPAALWPAVESGLAAGLAEGPHGHPVRGVHVRVVEAWYDILDATPEDVARAVADAVRCGVRAAGTAVWEPWCDVMVIVPAAFVGSVLSTVGACRGRTTAIEDLTEETSIRALVPDREVERLGARIDADTRGRGWILARASHHEPFPDALRARESGGRGP